MRLKLFVTWTLAWILSLTTPWIYAQNGEDRLAFVIGNADYPGSGALLNPGHDAKAMTDFFQSQGFETYAYKNLRSQQVSELRQQLEKRITRNSVVFFYYAGHGVQFEGRNYLLPIDAKFNSGEAIAEDSLYLGDILSAIEKRRPRLAVVILDACRDNPFARDKTANLGKGLARVDPPSSTVVFYATRPGGVASDGTQGNGLFTQSLLKEFAAKDQPLEVLFRRASTAVYSASRGDQEPWIEGVIRQEFAFAKPQAVPPTSASLQSLPAISSTTAAASAAVHAAEKINLTALSPEEVKSRIRSLAQTPKEDDPTSVVCEESACYDYRQWVNTLSSQERLDDLKKSLKQFIAQPLSDVCIFNPERFNCQDDRPIKMLVIYPLAPVLPSMYIKGFEMVEPHVTPSGGLSFKVNPRSYRGETRTTCLDTEGGLQFGRERVQLEMARMTCFNLFMPGSVKNVFQVLMVDLHKREILAHWDSSVISFMTYGSNSNLIRLKF